MKRVGHLYEKVCDIENIKTAILKASKGKRSRDDVRRVLSDIPKYAEIVQRQLLTEAFDPADYRTGTVKEGSTQKVRQIFKPNFFPDQIVHWAIMLQLQPVLRKGMYEITCGSIPGRGVHYGKKFIEKWLANDRKNTRYYLKLDISKFYPSIDTNRLERKLSTKIKDKRLLGLIHKILAKGDGLPIGILISQWFANFYLQDLDHYIKQDLKAIYYVRYMDDMVIFGPNKRKLHQMRKAIDAMLTHERLRLKPNWQVYKTDKEPLDFVGFRFYRGHTTLRKSIMLRITRKARKIGKKIVPTYHDACGMISYMGWITHSNSHRMFEKWVKPFLHIQILKRIIKEGTRKEFYHEANPIRVSKLPA